MASLSEQKYLTLRKRLDQFGFKQPLAIESLPLVEKLFQAFIQTTEELKKAKEVKRKKRFAFEIYLCIN
jgi:centrosomal protein CEP135